MARKIAMLELVRTLERNIGTTIYELCAAARENRAPDCTVQKISHRHQDRFSGSGLCQGEMTIAVWPMPLIASLNVVDHHCVAQT